MNFSRNIFQFQGFRFWFTKLNRLAQHLKILFNKRDTIWKNIMSDEINRKVTNIFSRHNKDLPPVGKEQVKFYAGFNYVRIDKDANGNKFNAEHLVEYSEKCHYIVRVMREVNNNIFLYNYDVPNSDLFKFMKSFDENTLDGTIIEIDKYFPEDLA